MPIDRRAFVEACAAVGLTGLLPGAVYAQVDDGENEITVDHMQMRRARTALMQQTHAALEGIDVFVSPSFQGGTLGITNLTGHPCVCVPNAFRPATSEEGKPDPPDYRKQPGSISFVGVLYRDDAALRLAHAYQQETDFDERRPPVR